MFGFMGFSLVACASNPQQTVMTLDERDPQYSSRECLDARNIAMQYDDKVISRMGIGLGLGLLLGPFGIPLAIMADMNQNEKRDYLNIEIDKRCKTQPYQGVQAIPDTNQRK
jgi:hypothetical protein